MVTRIGLVVVSVLVLVNGMFGCRGSNKVDSKAQSERAPQSLNIIGPNSIYNLITKLNAEIKDPALFNRENCASAINQVTDLLYDVPQDKYSPHNREDERFLRANGPRMVREIFALRVAIHDRFAEFENPSNECQAAVRESMRFTRFAEDVLIEWMIAKRIISGNADKAFSRTNFPHLILNPKFEKFELQAGDLVLMRGERAVGATIARSGDMPSDFAHVGVIGADHRGRKYMIEGLIETGVIYKPLNEWMKKSESRLVVFRPRNQDLGYRAGRGCFEWISEKKANRQNVPYDFAMDMNDNYQKYFCSEVAKYCYDVPVGEGGISLPTYPMTFNGSIKNQLFKSLGVANATTFAPVDVEIDPHFEIVAEFRNIANLRRVRMHDAILQQVFAWMNHPQYPYEIKSDYLTILTGILGGFLKDLQLDDKFGIGPDIQNHMNRKAIEIAFMLQKLGDRIEEKVKPIETDYYLKNGHAMGFKDLAATVEKVRIQDCVEHRANSTNSNLIHAIFAPAKDCPEKAIGRP